MGGELASTKCDLCGTAGIGRQATLRSLCPYGRMGSSPLFRTNRGSGHVVPGIGVMVSIEPLLYAEMME